MKKFKLSAQNLEADMEELHRYIVEQVQSGAYETHLEAIAAYMEQNDIDMQQIAQLISPAMKGIIYNEAVNKNMVSPFPFSIIPEELF